jgi:uncharacterized protein
MYYERLYSKKIKKIMNFFPVIILSGARQSGKTTLLKKTFGSYNYISLDLPSKAEQAENNPDDFLKTHPAPLLIDEVQYAPGLFRYLKTFIDNNRHDMGKLVLTGSQKFSLMKNITESLAGRCVWLELENLSYNEISSGSPFKLSQDSYLKLITRGQFPELWRVQEMPAYDFYSSYLATYLERDVRELLNVTSLRNFERFIRIMASRSGNMLNKTDIAKDAGVSIKAIGDWISVLEASGQITLLEPWFSNFNKRIVKTPKIYFNDSGLLCFLLGLDKNSIISSPYLGAVWETFLFSELRKINASLEHPVNFWYYRDQRAREIDFISENGGKLSFIEVKWKTKPDHKDTNTIKTISRELSQSNLKLKAGQHFVFSKCTESFDIEKGIKAVNINNVKDVLTN